MPRSTRNDEGNPTAAAARQVFEQLGFARSEVERAEQDLARLRKKHGELQHQVEVVSAENAQLERDLLLKLGTWRKLDDANVRAEGVLPQMRAVTGSLCYRTVRLFLHAVNRGLGIVTLRAFRR